MNLGNAIKHIREQKGIRQNAFAKLCNISQTYLSQVENNLKEPTISLLRMIADKIDVPLPIIFFLALDDSDIKPEKKNAFKHLSPAINSMILEFFANSISSAK